jgi:hypothetical protein
VLSLAALILAAASAASSPPLTSASPWWERVTYTISGEGAQQTCRYESSVPATGTEACDDEVSEPIAGAASGAAGAYTKITIERRFTPGDRPDAASLEPGDTLLGGQVMMLAIDEAGTVSGCRLLAASGDLRPAYGCSEARAERFQASAARGSREVRRGFMTILVYGHEGHLA